MSSECPRYSRNTWRLKLESNESSLPASAQLQELLSKPDAALRCIDGISLELGDEKLTSNDVKSLEAVLERLIRLKNKGSTSFPLVRFKLENCDVSKLKECDVPALTSEPITDIILTPYLLILIVLASEDYVFESLGTGRRVVPSQWDEKRVRFSDHLKKLHGKGELDLQTICKGIEPYLKPTQPLLIPIVELGNLFSDIRIPNIKEIVLKALPALYIKITGREESFACTLDGTLTDDQLKFLLGFHPALQKEYILPKTFNPYATEAYVIFFNRFFSTPNFNIDSLKYHYDIFIAHIANAAASLREQLETAIAEGLLHAFSNGIKINFKYRESPSENLKKIYQTYQDLRKKIASPSEEQQRKLQENDQSVEKAFVEALHRRYSIELDGNPNIGLLEKIYSFHENLVDLPVVQTEVENGNFGTFLREQYANQLKKHVSNDITKLYKKYHQDIQSLAAGERLKKTVEQSFLDTLLSIDVDFVAGIRNSSIKSCEELNGIYAHYLELSKALDSAASPDEQKKLRQKNNEAQDSFIKRLEVFCNVDFELSKVTSLDILHSTYIVYRQIIDSGKLPNEKTTTLGQTLIKNYTYALKIQYKKYFREATTLGELCNIYTRIKSDIPDENMGEIKQAFVETCASTPLKPLIHVEGVSRDEDKIKTYLSFIEQLEDAGEGAGLDTLLESLKTTVKFSLFQSLSPSTQQENLHLLFQEILSYNPSNEKTKPEKEKIFIFLLKKEIIESTGASENRDETLLVNISNAKSLLELHNAYCVLEQTLEQELNKFGSSFRAISNKRIRMAKTFTKNNNAANRNIKNAFSTAGIDIQENEKTKKMISKTAEAQSTQYPESVQSMALLENTEAKRKEADSSHAQPPPSYGGSLTFANEQSRELFSLHERQRKVVQQLEQNMGNLQRLAQEKREGIKQIAYLPKLAAAINAEILAINVQMQATQASLTAAENTNRTLLEALREADPNFGQGFSPSTDPPPYAEVAASAAGANNHLTAPGHEGMFHKPHTVNDRDGKKIVTPGQ